MKFSELKVAEEVLNNEKTTGVPVHYFVSALEDCFHKSTYENFQKFIKQNTEYKKWMIFPDYVLGDKEKSNDVIVFSILLHKYDFDKFGNYIITSAVKYGINTC